MKFDQSNTRFDLEVKDWKEAIKSSVSMLERKGFCDEDYKHNIIKDVEKYGSYIMIAPDIVIPHTRPENGAVEIGYCLTTIKNDVYFDDNKVDPIKVLIAFTAVDSENHIEMLKDIFRVIEIGLVNKLDIFMNLSEDEKLKYLNSLIKEER